MEEQNGTPDQLQLFGDGSYNIAYDDGDKEDGVRTSLIRLLQEEDRSAQPESAAIEAQAGKGDDKRALIDEDASVADAYQGKPNSEDADDSVEETEDIVKEAPDDEIEEEHGGEVESEPDIEPEVEPEVVREVEPDVEPDVEPEPEPEVKPEAEPKDESGINSDILLADSAKRNVQAPIKELEERRGDGDMQGLWGYARKKEDKAPPSFEILKFQLKSLIHSRARNKEGAANFTKAYCSLFKTKRPIDAHEFHAGILRAGIVVDKLLSQSIFSDVCSGKSMCTREMLLEFATRPELGGEFEDNIRTMVKRGSDLVRAFRRFDVDGSGNIDARSSTLLPNYQVCSLDQKILSR